MKNMRQRGKRLLRVNKGYLTLTLPPIILKAGTPRISVSRAKVELHEGQKQLLLVKS
jgi:hypothetical protein